jgi:hypothetical protein
MWELGRKDLVDALFFFNRFFFVGVGAGAQGPR